jgi:hypothetical protein
LATLADNGGPTRTLALLPDSPAINTGDTAARAGVDGVPLGDQRGAQFTRVYGGRIDIGAFERQPTEFLLGDFNRNKTIDAADLILWRKANGRSDDIGNYVDARGNGDGIVDESDYKIWRANFGNTLRVSATDQSDDLPVDPEPDDQETAALPINPSPSIGAFQRAKPVVRASFAATTATVPADEFITLLAEYGSRRAVRDDGALLTPITRNGRDTYEESVDLAFTTFVRGVQGAIG